MEPTETEFLEELEAASYLIYHAHLHFGGYDSIPFIIARFPDDDLQTQRIALEDLMFALVDLLRGQARVDHWEDPRARTLVTNAELQIEVLHETLRDLYTLG